MDRMIIENRKRIEAVDILCPCLEYNSGNGAGGLELLKAMSVQVLYIELLDD